MTPRPLNDAVWFARCSPTEKLVLLCIAYHAKPGGGGAYPGIRRISKLTGCAKSTVQNSIATLVGRGYISITQHGSQVAANEYQIHIGKLMENELDAPDLRAGVCLVPAQGVYLPPAQGVPGGVPIRETGVCRSDAKAVPEAGTEQSTNRSTQLKEQDEGTELWRAARQNLKEALPTQTWETWIRPLTEATLESGKLAVQLPDPVFEVVATRQKAELFAALDKASAATGLQFESLVFRCAESPTVVQTTHASQLSPTKRLRKSA
jgi:hypothetical protein